MIGLIALFFIVSCGGKGTVRSGEASDSGPSSVVLREIAGEWEAENLGDVMEQYGYSLPAKFTFRENGTYVWEYVRGGRKIRETGRFILIDIEQEPYKIDFIREKTGPVGQDMEDVPDQSLGIFSFTENGRLRTIFYNKNFLGRPKKFGDTETQIYRKVSPREPAN
jgi:hypothetical protein